ncbi:MAG: GMC oxidoreductase [Paracraurococcus sp.]
MILDARRLAPDMMLDVDICIVGGGPAGITLASELDGTGVSVLLLEAGGRRFEPATQTALQGAVAPDSPHAPPDMYRRRMLGGASAIWGGRCFPLDPIDLERRPHVPHSGWPIGWPELEAHYPRAMEYVEAGPYDFAAAGALGTDAPPAIAGFAHPDVLDDRIERFSPPTRFGEAHAARLARSASVRVLVHAQALRLVAPDREVEALEVGTAPGRRFTVRARRYVLAAGGLETTRLLLASDATRRGGLGNQGGALGRYYMCHLENTLGWLRLRPADRPLAIEYEQAPDGSYVRRHLTLSPAAQRRERLLHTVFRLHHPLIADPAHRNGVLSAMYLVKDAVLPEYRRKLAAMDIAARDRLRRDPQFWARHLANVARDAPGVMRFGVDWTRRRVLARRKLPSVLLRSGEGAYPLEVSAEQVPNPDSRISLLPETDAHGMPRLRIDWRATRLDYDSMAQSMRVLRAAFAASGTGDLQFEEERMVQETRAAMPVGGHHIGTARMAASARDGVVDADCRVHGLANLHVAGAAVFPTCGHASPTLTVVALAVRLADHLKRDLVQSHIAAAPRSVAELVQP